MRVAILGGRNPHTAKWVYGLLERGYEVSLISLDNLQDWDGVPVYRLPFGMPAGYYLGWLSLRRILQRIKPDLLHVHYASGYGTLGRLSGFRPCILSVWGSDVYDFPYQSLQKRRLLEANLHHYDHVCSTSQAMADQVLRLCPNLTRPTVTPFGIDTSIFIPDPSERDAGCVTLGIAKTMKPLYGIDLLLEAFARVRRQRLPASQPLRLLIAGDGPQKPELELLARTLGVDDAVQFIGRIPNTDVPAFLNKLDVFVNPSRRESFGVAVLEASACGLPVVTSDADGLPEVIQPGITGLMFEKEDVGALANALATLVDDESLRQQMGSAGREFVRSTYELADCVTTMEQVYAQVLGR